MAARPDLLALFLPSMESGGVQRVMLNLAEGMAQRGVRVDLVLARASGPFLAEIASSTRLVDLKARRVVRSLPALVRYLRLEQPQVMLSAQPHCNLVATWAWMMTRRRGRLVVSEHNSLSNDLRHAVRVSDRLFPLLIRVFYPKAAAIVAVSSGVADDLARRTGLSRDSIDVIYNPIVSPRLSELACMPLEHPWFAPGQPPVILSVGRLSDQKDHATLLRAFSILRARQPLHLVILGEGVRRPQLHVWAARLGIQNDLDLPGFDANPYRYMANCAVFALSSAWEGFGNVLAEALACGAQVVSTDCESGPAEILDNGTFGRLVPVGDPDALAEAIQAALTKPFPVEQLRRRAQEFSVDVALQKYMKVLYGMADA